MSSVISLCMMVKNEARTLRRCLESVKDLVDEIIVVDTGSTDTTLEIAREYGAKTVAFDFEKVNFGAARNHAIAQATGRWILVLDADEVLKAESVGRIRELAAESGNAGYFLERWNHRADGQPATPDFVVRLFPNRPEYRYKGRVHETIDASIVAGGGKLIRTDVRIDHEFASDPAARTRRNLWYIEILKEEIAADPADYTRLDFLAAEYHQMGMFDQATEVAEQIARLKPQAPEAHLNVGIYHLLYKLNRESARSNFQEALRLRPGYSEAHAFLQLMKEQDTPKS